MKFISKRRYVAAAIVAAIVAGAAVIGVAGATGGDDDQPLTGETRDRAVAAALAHTGGGTVLEAEVGDDGAAYEVEVRLPNGRVVEVELDGSYKVIASAEDDDDADDRDGTEDDD